MKKEKEWFPGYLIMLLISITLNWCLYKLIKQQIEVETTVFIITLMFTGYLLGRIDAYFIYKRRID